MTIKRFKRVTRTWEYTIAITICVILLYRVALIYDLVPEQLKPSVFFAKQYKNAKIAINEHATGTGTGAKTAKMAIGIMQDTEKYFAQRAKYAKQVEAARAKCDVNPVYRLFMQYGDNDYTQCINREIARQQQKAKVLPSQN